MKLQQLQKLLDRFAKDQSPDSEVSFAQVTFDEDGEVEEIVYFDIEYAGVHDESVVITNVDEEDFLDIMSFAQSSAEDEEDEEDEEDSDWTNKE